ncbi:MAG: sigma-54 dependent transcriptional regulator [Gammaproteobacteria bacterium]|nr:sigma-54 dependent transcriptional regulator [Gammaproteobacteria bacterium]
MTASRRVLIVDDEPNMRRVLEIMLGRRGYRTDAAADGEEAWERLRDGGYDLVCSDLRMPRLDGIELLRRMRDQGLDLPLILMTAHGSLDSAVEALRLGACDYLLRPFDVEALELAIDRVFATRGLLRQNAYLRDEAARPVQSGLLGRSAPMVALREQVAKVGPTRASVLLTGETGTGKEVVARAIHQASERRDALFVAVNCAAIPADMLESELFGHEKGAFTGAQKQRIGKFELAQGGTLFLDELGEMPIALQAKLLRAIEAGEISRLGGNDPVTLDVRLIAATNRAPREAIRDGRLREDLYFRLNVFALELPPLRARREDVGLLFAHFLGQPETGLPVAVLDHLASYGWPGNVRELRNMAERARILAGASALAPRHFPLPAEPAIAEAPSTAALPDDLALDPAVETLERRYLEAALKLSGGNKARAAQKLGISERTIWYKLKKYGLGD